MLQDSEFKLSARNRRFLAFVVTETLEGRQDRIKAYPIGVDVFGRGDDFDPALDPIVRIEATRIRMALATYYRSSGVGDVVQITIPPGSYIPKFEWARAAPLSDAEQAASLSTSDARASPSLPAFVITHHSDRKDRCATSRGELLVSAVLQRLSAAGCEVFLMSPVDRKTPEKALKPLLAASRSVYAVEVTVHALEGVKRYDWRLSDLRNRRVGWSESSDHADEGHPSAEMIDGLARRIVERSLTVAR
ncbi:hypothetical protein [Hansschlegelia zhihuaiae]|uniref:Uncharacterized protein n=1 Tax=Hansschlegelia zhihuaiae TaxID=405005 RepID=A0A4Q0MKU2_9HYPH|nr:hypothetical protein [Hansschlegelia zhihuaiae]RXF73719.1 hypothetical protein EK403_09030 [Hansschlegelia zhihuaiae]